MFHEENLGILGIIALRPIYVYRERHIVAEY